MHKAIRIISSLILAMIFFCSCDAAESINFSNYIKVYCDGMNGSGTAIASLDYGTLSYDLFGSTPEENTVEYDEYIKKCELLRSGISVNAESTYDLSNGDIVPITVTCIEDILEELNLNVQTCTYSALIDGLPKYIKSAEEISSEELEFCISDAKKILRGKLAATANNKSYINEWGILSEAIGGHRNSYTLRMTYEDTSIEPIKMYFANVKNESNKESNNYLSIIYKVSIDAEDSNVQYQGDCFFCFEFRDIVNSNDDILLNYEKAGIVNAETSLEKMLVNTIDISSLDYEITEIDLENLEY